MVDIPGKRRLERRILRAPGVLALANRLRARFGQSPFRIHSDTDQACSGGRGLQ
jgi:hypothetical protein